MSTPGHAANDLVVDSVDWLPSGASSGLIRVRGHSVSGASTVLPQLLVEDGEDARQFSSLPDPRAGREPGTWRGAYVLEARPGPDARLALVWPDGARLELPSSWGAPPEGGEVVDRTVLAERRVRRAEASEQAQARIAQEALRAVEVLELRAAEIEAERDTLRAQILGDPVLELPPVDSDAEVERLRMALDIAQRDAAVEVAELHGDLEDARAALAGADLRNVDTPGGPQPPDAAPSGSELEDVGRLRAELAEAQARVDAAEPELAHLRAELTEAHQHSAAAEHDLARLRAELARATTSPLLQTDTEHHRAVVIAERRAVRLRSALTSTIATVAELRLRLHEADIARRTREVGHSADAVRLTILDAEHDQLEHELEIRRHAMDDLAAAQAALDELRALHAEQGRELAASQDRVAALEDELVAAREDAERAVAEAIASTRLVAEAAAAERADEQIAAAEALTAEAERVAEELRAELAGAQTAREVAEAGAAAANVGRAAAGVRTAAPVPSHSGLSEQLDRARESLRAARAAAAEAGADRWAPPIAAMQAAAEAPPAAEPIPAFAPPVAPDVPVVEHAPPVDDAPVDDETPASDAPTVEAPAAEDAPDPIQDLKFEEVIPNTGGPQATRSSIAPFPLELIGAAERQTTDPGQPTEEQERVVADLDAAAAALRRGPEIISPTEDPPNDLARGRGIREYPPLRGALVKLAHDDPTAAARVIVGLLNAQHVAFGDPLDWDLTITELGTFGVASTTDATTITRLDEPRGRPHAAFHLRGDALSVAESVAGVGDRPSRLRGGLRTSGRVRDARRLLATAETPPTLAALISNGAELEPALIVRAFTYAVPAGWTAGQSWSVDLVVEQTPIGLVARPTGGLVSERPQDEPDARIHLDAQGFRDLVAGTEQPLRIEGDKAVVGRLLALVERVHQIAG
ncbi:MAG: hypothetical protein QOF76_3955 [Solirubrobacteraceae bacterium]|nr:hypothetical protein [Solirubrobacteraceae bacterium]